MEKQDLDHCEKNMVVKNECFLCKASNCNEYKPSPCKCFESCKKCAMKVATGGKCRICKQFFTNMSRFVGESTDSSSMHQGDDEIDPEDIEILEKQSEGGTR
mmetsp:Transcript_9408/g.9210  ORF Transcript_9408/g.9210 Transcript_9408/m.9210 type:complete len:102 (+) Transcript_9408:242-547(+)